MILIGNLGRDPEQRNLNDGSPVVNLSLATSERWTDQQGSDRYATEVVLRRFNGSMQMLDARGKGDNADDGSYGGDAAAGRAASAHPARTIAPLSSSLSSTPPPAR